MVISTNIQAAKISDSLNTTQARLNKSLARLSSGMKIIEPTDDAAGQAVSMRLDAQIKRIDAARNNTANAVSLTQMQDGYLSKIAKALDRMSELSMLSQDVIKSSADRELYNSEFVQLTQFIKDSANKSFNGVTLFSPSDMSVANDSEGNVFTMRGINLSTQAYNNSLYALSSSFTKGTVTINGQQVNIDSSDSLDQILTKINATGIAATYVGGAITLTDANPISLGASTDTSNFLEMTQLKANGTGSTTSAMTSSWSPLLSSSNFATAITAGTFIVSGATVTVATTDTLQEVFDKIKAATGGNVIAGYDSSTDKITLSSAAAITLSDGTSNFLTAAKLSANGASAVTSDNAISSFLASPSAAVNTLNNVKAAIVKLAEHRALIGASQARLTYTQEQLQVHKENIAAASSRIEDVDMAQESTDYARYNIMMQAATAMLAQANAQPQNVLKLLQ